MHPREAPYTLEVDQHTETLPTGEKITRRWAGLFSHDPSKPTSDTNPTIREYIQQRPIPVADDAPARQPVACNILQPKKELQLEATEHVGWQDSRDVFVDFVETVINNYYLDTVEQKTLPIAVSTARSAAASTHSDPYDGTHFEITFCDNEETIEYVMWNSREIYTNTNSKDMRHDLLQKILAAVARAYEQPSIFIKNWSSHKVQIDSL